jgi:hypothetical protein
MLNYDPESIALEDIVKGLYLVVIGVIDHMDCNGPEAWQRVEQLQELKRAAVDLGQRLEAREQESDPSQVSQQ